MHWIAVPAMILKYKTAIGSFTNKIYVMQFSSFQKENQLLEYNFFWRGNLVPGKIMGKNEDYGRNNTCKAIYLTCCLVMKFLLITINIFIQLSAQKGRFICLLLTYVAQVMQKGFMQFPVSFAGNILKASLEMVSDA